MSPMTHALSLITALISGGIYDTSETCASRSSEATSSVVRGVDTSDEDLRMMIEARIALGNELRKR